MSAYGLLKYCCLLLALFLMLNVTLGERLALLGRAQRLLYFQHLSVEDLCVPRWQTVWAVTYVGVLLGLPFNFVHLDVGVQAGRMVLSVTGTWLAIGAAAVSLRGWMRRGGHWDGRGSVLSFVAAATLIVGTFVAVLFTVGAPAWVLLPAGLYVSAVTVTALKRLFPAARLADCLGGLAAALTAGMCVAWLFHAWAFMAHRV